MPPEPQNCFQSKSHCGPDGMVLPSGLRGVLHCVSDGLQMMVGHGYGASPVPPPGHGVHGGVIGMGHGTGAGAGMT
jgi:hypothetical protein